MAAYSLVSPAVHDAMRTALRNLIIILIILPTFFGLSSGTLAATITLAWDSNPPEDEVVGYIIYYGTASGRYRWAVDIGNMASYDLTGLTPGVTFFIALTAYDRFDNESYFSNEVWGVGTVIPPEVTWFQIENGVARTVNRKVMLNNTAINSPTHYMASESWSFTRARRLVYSRAPTFTLSAGAGTKAVYFKALNMDGESPVVSDTISLAPAVTSFKIARGAASTAKQEVRLNNAAVNRPTHYMASESSSFVGASWQTYSRAPKFTLSAGTGTKTVYIKVKNGFGDSPAVSDTIYSGTVT